MLSVRPSLTCHLSLVTCDSVSPVGGVQCQKEQEQAGGQEGDTRSLYKQREVQNTSNNLLICTSLMDKGISEGVSAGQSAVYYTKVLEGTACYGDFLQDPAEALTFAQCVFAPIRLFCVCLFWF